MLATLSRRRARPLRATAVRARGARPAAKPAQGASRSRRRPSPDWRSRSASTATSCTAAQAATRSSSPRCSRPVESRSPRPSATRCWRARHACRLPARRLLEAVAVVPGQVELWLLEALAGELGDRIDECLASGMLRAGRAARRVPARSRADRDRGVDRAEPQARTAPRRDRGARRRPTIPISRVSRTTPRPRATPPACFGGRRWRPRRRGLGRPPRGRRDQYARALQVRRRSATRGPRGALWRTRRGVPPERPDRPGDRRAGDARSSVSGRVGDRYGEGDSLRSLSRLLFFSGRVDEGEPIAREAIELLEQLPPGHELAMAYGNLSQRLMVIEDHAGAVAVGNSSGRAGKRARRRRRVRVRAHEHRLSRTRRRRARPGARSSSMRARWRAITASRTTPDARASCS